MKKLIHSFLLLCLLWSLAAAENQRPVRFNCNCTDGTLGNAFNAFGNPGGFGLFGGNGGGFNAEDDYDSETDSEDDMEEEGEPSFEERIAAQLEREALQVVLDDLTGHIEDFANGMLAEAEFNAYLGVAENIGGDFYEVRRGADFGRFLDTLRTLVEERLSELTAPMIDLGELHQQVLEDAIDELITEVEDRVTNNSDEDEVVNIFIGYVINNHLLYKLCGRAGEGYEDVADDAADRVRNNILLSLNELQYSFERRMSLWVNQRALREARSWIRGQLNALQAGPSSEMLQGYAQVFQAVGGVGDFGYFLARTHYQRALNALDQYVDGLYREMGIPHWVAFGVTEEERSNVGVVESVLEGCLGTYIQGHNAMEGDNLTYHRRLVVRVALASLYGMANMQQDANEWLGGAHRDLVRMLQNYRITRMVSLNSLGDGTHILNDGVTINIRVMKNGTHTADR